VFARAFEAPGGARPPWSSARSAHALPSCRVATHLTL
jgi:hypothetical protein